VGIAQRFPKAVGRVQNLSLVFQAFHGPSFPRLSTVRLLRLLFLLFRVRRKRYDSVPVSRIWARSVMRSSSALQSRAFGITCVHSENGRFVVRTTAPFQLARPRPGTETQRRLPPVRAARDAPLPRRYAPMRPSWWRTNKQPRSPHRD
jgi:hypothetical protein